jgi:hypothetical protein
MLSEPLRVELYSRIHGVIIRGCVVFRENYNALFLSALLEYFTRGVFSPEDNIID